MILVSVAEVSALLLSPSRCRLQPHLYEKHDIDSFQFVRSVQYYTAQTDLYIAIQKRIEARLEMAKKEAEDAKKINDSVNNRGPLNRDSLLLRRKKDTTRLIKT